MTEFSTPKIQTSKKNRNIKKRKMTETENALDDIVKVNMIFVLAASLAISDTSLDRLLSLEVAEKLAVFQATALAFFIIAMWVGASLKLSSVARDLMVAFSGGDRRFEDCSSVTSVWERVWINVSRAASIAGALFLALSNIYAVHIGIGLVSCGRHDALAALYRHAIRVASGYLIGYLYCYKLMPLLV